jgi:hypothetical protein
MFAVKKDRADLTVSKAGVFAKGCLNKDPVIFQIIAALDDNPLGRGNFLAFLCHLLYSKNPFNHGAIGG